MEVLKDGIKAVAVGVKGSKPIPDELVGDILKLIDWLEGFESDDLRVLEVRQRMASFLGTLFVKHRISSSDQTVLQKISKLRPQFKEKGLIRGGCSSHQMHAYICGGENMSSSEEISEILLQLLEGEKLTEDQAFQLGSKMFSSPLKYKASLSMAAHILRVRYESNEEFIGLLKAQNSSIDKTFLGSHSLKDSSLARTVV
eukprot:CAMPEP_0171469922 /NCGR_PEP_ID=MMETSP0945-20130129/11605_1 /TAXON_ID=109269 /ORGANISM="Vaucheria litorea, Strain CCMP2940" /LENGTH=199 /DNA_ID=CAMNT_0011999223 /DNA_START=80 /DNA_END=676 /DNA_ORIENTATION=+